MALFGGKNPYFSTGQESNLMEHIFYEMSNIFRLGMVLYKKYKNHGAFEHVKRCRNRTYHCLNAR